MNDHLNKIQEELDEFPKTFQTILLSTKTKEDEPFSSYAPFIYFNETYYFLISKIAQHYQNLENNHHVSIMMIEDESKTQNIFFRKRLSYLVNAEKCDTSMSIIHAFVEKFGPFVERLFKMDFVIVKCELIEGNMIVGPGQAYKINNNQKIENQMTGNNELPGHGN